MTLNWFLSGTVRHAAAMCKHVRKLLNHQRDILSPNAVSEVEKTIQETRQVLSTTTDKAALKKQMESLEQSANKWLKPYPHPAWRENFEVLLVALAVAMGVRTFFLQPFKIPTGSMQPTLYGVTSDNLAPDFKIPTGWQRIKSWFGGTSFLHIVAPEDGEFQGADEPFRLAIFNIHQKIYFGGKAISIWFPPDYGSALLAPNPRGTRPNVQLRSNAQIGQFFKKGEDIIKLRINAGDHLFVDRVSYNFRAPARGEIIVFETHGLDALNALVPDQGDTFYIKRLIGLGGESVSLHPDFSIVGVPGLSPDATLPAGRVAINGTPLSPSTPHFENLYSATGRAPTLRYVENQYVGHALAPTGDRLKLDEGYAVSTNCVFVLGDNTLNSLDSRYWGDFPKSKVIGKSFFVYWPLTPRFGWGTSSH
jgi:signal peptidase I